MKTLILYASKHGASREIAHRISKNISGATVCDLKQKDIPPLEQFECVIVGGSLYAGMLRKEAKLFVSQNADALRSKKLGLFLSGMNANGEQAYFESNFPKDVLSAAKAKSFLGGVFDPQKAGAIERMIMKAVAKQSGYSSDILDDKIEKFAETLTK